MRLETLNGTWQVRQADSAEWMQGMVPGDVHTTLMAAGKIEDPFVGDNEKRAMWVAETDWEYRRTFSVSADLLQEDQVYLVCDGLDTLADVTLNGHAVGHAENMFRQYAWDVKSILKTGENEVSIRFGGPVAYIKVKQAEKPLIGGGDILGGPYLRKAPYQFGWDWGPKLPPIGIWKDIAVVGWSQARLEDVHLRQTLKDGSAAIWAEVTVEAWTDQPTQVHLNITTPAGENLQATADVRGGCACPRIEIANPALWWPNGYGEQPLYQVQVVLQTADAELEARDYQIGLRTIELRREPDQWGESFTFVVNGVPIFAKGSDWIPADSFPTRISDAYMEDLIRSAAMAHMNMLRVWGGGLYEEERFYDLCDRYGLLIWQDFVFACGIYPTDAEFFANVRVEAIQNVRRLRHRASLALWCGNNEMEQGWAEWGWNKPEDVYNQTLKEGYDRMFHHMLPDVCAAEDPDHAYWPSSASSGIPFAQPSSQLRGDCHYWDVWHGRKPFTAYRSQFPRFMSEFGFQALPPFKTIAAFAEEKDRNMTSYIMEHHQRSGPGNGLMIGQMTETFRMPNDFSALVYLSMVLQAEGIRYGVEHWRRNMNRVSGTLIWQLNDCWPVASWSSIDYYGRWKALHYAAKRFYAPVLLSIEDSGTSMSVHVTSDLTQPWNGRIYWRLAEVGGKVIEKGEDTVNAAALADTHVFTRDFSAVVEDANRRGLIFVAELWQGDRRMELKIATFAPNKHLELVDPQIKTEVSEVSGLLTIAVSAHSLARFVELSMDEADVVFSDNYFDIPADTTVTVTASLPEGWTVEQARRALRVYSLYQSY